MADLEMLSVVALLEDRGHVGTVVERWEPGLYEVEFSDTNGRTYAIVTLKPERVLPLDHEPVNHAA